MNLGNFKVSLCETLVRRICGGELTCFYSIRRLRSTTSPFSMYSLGTRLLTAQVRLPTVTRFAYVTAGALRSYSNRRK